MPNTDSLSQDHYSLYTWQSDAYPQTELQQSKKSLSSWTSVCERDIIFDPNMISKDTETTLPIKTPPVLGSALKCQ